MPTTSRDDDRLARMEARQDALIRGMAQMNETLAAQTAILERILMAAAEEPAGDGNELADALRRMAQALAGQEAAMTRLEARLAALPNEIAGALVPEPA